MDTRLTDFLRTDMDPILEAWEEFARAAPPATDMVEAVGREPAKTPGSDTQPPEPERDE